MPFNLGHPQFNTGRTHFKENQIPWNKGKKYINMAVRKRVIKICQNCSQEFEIEKWRLKDPTRGKFCTTACSRKYHAGERSHFFGKAKLKGKDSPYWKDRPTCIDCNKELKNTHAQRCRFCEDKNRCGAGHPLFGKKRPEISKEKHPNWKGGTTLANKIERVRFKKTLQKLIFERDNYQCQICDSKTDLQVDHIQSWAEFKELRFDPDNCRTLCARCHYKLTFGREMPPTIKKWGHNLGKGGY